MARKKSVCKRLERHSKSYDQHRAEVRIANGSSNEFPMREVIQAFAPLAALQGSYTHNRSFTSVVASLHLLIS
jgi:hypothetical protein